MKRLSIILIVVIMTSCYQWSNLYFVIPPVSKTNNNNISKLHNSIYYNLTKKDIKEIKKLALKEKFHYRLLKYFKKEDKFIFRDGTESYSKETGSIYKYGIYSKRIDSDELILLKNFDKLIDKFIFNPDKSKIFIEFYKKGFSIGIYSFPEFKLLKDNIWGREARLDSNSNKLYYIKGGENSKLCALDENYKETVVYNDSLKTYRILTDSDKLIVIRDELSLFELVFKGWKYKYKSFLLSNPNKILAVSGSSIGAVKKSLEYLKKRKKTFQSDNITEYL